MGFKLETFHGLCQQESPDLVFIAAYLKRYNVSVNASIFKVGDNHTTIMHFFGSRDPEVLVLLDNIELDEEPDYSLKDHNNNTPLHYYLLACIAQTTILVPATVNFFLSHFSCPQEMAEHLISASTQNQQHPLGLMIQLRNTSLIIHILKYLEVSSVNVANVLNALTLDQKTSMHLAVISKQTRLVSLFMKYGANASAQDANGYTPIHFAVVYGKVSMLRTLIQYISPKDLAILAHDGMTALHVAASSGHEDCVRLLMKKMYTTDIMDLKAKNQYTAQQIAIYTGQNGCAKLIADYLNEKQNSTVGVYIYLNRKRVKIEEKTDAGNSSSETGAAYQDVLTPAGLPRKKQKTDKTDLAGTSLPDVTEYPPSRFIAQA